MVRWEREPIPLSHTLGSHVEAIDPNDLWNSIKQGKKYTRTAPAYRSGPFNSTAIDPNTSPRTTPTSPIVEHHVDMSQSEGSSLETVSELLEDPKIQPGMMQSAMNVVTSLFTPSKTVQAVKNDSQGNPHQMSAASTSSDMDVTDITRELNTYKDRLALELTNFKKQLRAKLKLNVQNKI